jgi:hypothetical protein
VDQEEFLEITHKIKDMAKKRIKITESQLRLLEDIENVDKTKKLRITEAQYQRLFNNDKQQLAEGFEMAGDFIQFAGELINLLKMMLTNPSQEGLSPFWQKIGVTWGDMMTLLSSFGIITVGAYGAHGAKKIQKVNKRGIIRKLKALYNEFCENPRYDLSNGKVINYDKQNQEEGIIGLGTDIEMTENGNYPPGASDDPFAPYNREDEPEKPMIDSHFNLIKEVYDGEGSFLYFLGDMDDKYVVIVSKNSATFEDECGHGVDADCVISKLTRMDSNGELEIGDCGYDCGSHLIHRLTEEMKGYIMEYHATNEEARRELQEVMMVEETTTTGASSGSFEAPLGGSSPIKRKMHPSDELNEEPIDEVTDSSSSGAYEQPKIWAKDPKLSRFSNDPMYPEGEIVEGEEKVQRYVLNLGEVYVYGKNDQEAKAEAKSLIKLINSHFNEADANPKSLHKQGNLGSGEKAKEVDLFERVAKKTGKTVAEVKQIIKKNTNKE